MSTPHCVAQGATSPVATPPALSRWIARLGLVAAAVVLGASVAALVVVPRLSKPIASADVGTTAPDFQLFDADGHQHTLSAHRGQAVVLYFGSIHCPKTAGYNARVDELARRYATEQRIQFYAVDVSGSVQPSDPAQVRVDSRVIGRTFPTLIDDRGAVAARYSASGMPLLVVIDPRGQVRYRGPFDDHKDADFVTHRFCADAVREVLQRPSVTVADAVQVRIRG